MRQSKRTVSGRDRQRIKDCRVNELFFTKERNNFNLETELL